MSTAECVTPIPVYCPQRISTAAPGGPIGIAPRPFQKSGLSGYDAWSRAWGGHEATRPSRSFARRDRFPARGTREAGGKTMKKRRLKTAAPKRRKARAAVRRRDSPAAASRETVALLKRERDEALEQQRATAEVLRVISSSPGELEPVFQTILENAARICQAQFGTLNLYDGSAFRTVALHNPPSQFALRLGAVIRPHPESGLAHVARTTQIAHIDDLRTRQPFLEGNEAVVDLVDLSGARTLLIVPMLNAGKLVGAISIYRQEVRPFADRQIDLVKNFAVQVVIAIENTRLFDAEQQRTRELTESLEQQTATSEVLRVISSSPGELEPVFDAMLENATRICEAKVGTLFLYDGGDFRAVAVHGESDYADWFRRDPMARVREQSGSPLDRLTRTKQVIHILDLRQEQSYIDGNDRMVSLVETAGARTHLVVPMLKDRELVGAIVIYRQEVKPFTEKQIALVQNFAAQAVIAIENSRLLNELRQRTDDLSESLEQQTATSEVLRVISSSPGELEPVFKTILESATRICEAKLGAMALYEDGGCRIVSLNNAPPAYADQITRDPFFRPHPEHPLSWISKTKQIVHVSDAAAQPEHARGRLADLAGARTLLAVPMLMENELLGAIAIYRQEVLPFTDKQIALVQNFAAQAVIAIENTRLLNEFC